MQEAIYIQIPAAPAKQDKFCTRVSCERPCSSSACGACTRQDWKDYGPQIVIVAAVFLAALIGLIIFLVRTN